MADPSPVKTGCDNTAAEETLRKAQRHLRAEQDAMLARMLGPGYRFLCQRRGLVARTLDD